MDSLDVSTEFLSLTSLVLLLLMNANRALSLSIVSIDEEDLSTDVEMAEELSEGTVLDMNSVSRTALLHFRLWNTLSVLDAHLDFWVKPRSTTWFLRFLLEEYDDARWVQLFRLIKHSMFTLSHLLAPHIRRRDTRYRLAVLVLVRVACALFKLSHGASLLICSEMFAVGRSTVSIILREVVQSVNVVLRREISWPSGESLASTAADFQHLCGLPGVVGAIDGTHFSIKKPRFGSTDYYYFKSGGFTITCQAVVDSSKRFIDLYVGMLGSTNDSRMLRRSTLYRKGQLNSLWDGSPSFHGFSPSLLGDSGYPLLSWLMVPHRQQRDLSVAEELFNKRLSRGRAVVENAFGLLKVTFRELQHRSDLNVSFMPDVVTACAILHNVLLQQSHEEVERLLDVLQAEGFQQNLEEETIIVADATLPAADHVPLPASQQKRQQLGAYLSLQRIVPM